jgi:hypothetical protein
MVGLETIVTTKVYTTKIMETTGIPIQLTGKLVTITPVLVVS